MEARDALVAAALLTACLVPGFLTRDAGPRLVAEDPARLTAGTLASNALERLAHDPAIDRLLTEEDEGGRAASDLGATPLAAKELGGEAMEAAIEKYRIHLAAHLERGAVPGAHRLTCVATFRADDGSEESVTVARLVPDDAATAPVMR